MFRMPSPVELLTFEGEWPVWSGRKDLAIRARFNITPARYHQLLFRAAVSMEGQAAQPLTAHRISQKLMNPKR
jgi:hypothetical protein